MNIRNVDLNLLVVLNELIELQNTIKVAAKLNLSQPAVSHALKRLRETFNDPLLVRASRGLTPTRKALELKDPVSAFLKNVEQLFNNAENKFDPQKAKITFRIATTDYMEQVLLPKLITAIENDAPGCTLITRPTLGALPKAELEDGALDLAIAGFYTDLPDNFYFQNLFQDDFVCVARQNHPLFKGKLSLEKYSKAKHILISPQGDMQAKSKAILKKNGLTQNFLAGVSSFTSPGWIPPQTDLILTCPRKLATAYQKFLPVKIQETPFNIGKISLIQVWHARHHADPAHVWLRNLIHKLCQ